MAVSNTDFFFIPHPSSCARTGASLTAISGNSDAYGFVFKVPKTGTIDKITFIVAAKTTNGTIDVRLETVTASTGDPSGTLYGTNTNGSVTINAANTEFTATLTAGAAVTQGDMVAVVLKNPGASPPNYALKGNTAIITYTFPYIDLFTSSAWATNTSPSPAIGIHYSSPASQYYDIAGPATLIPAASTVPSKIASVASTSSPNRYGNVFTAPGPLEVTGVWADLSTPTDGSGSITYELYDSNNVVIATTPSIGGGVAEIIGTNNQILRFYQFTSKVVLVAGNTYRIIARASTNVTSISNFNYLDYSDDAHLFAHPSGGNFKGTDSGDGVTWTDRTGRFMYIGLICSGISVPSNDRSWSFVG